MKKYLILLIALFVNLAFISCDEDETINSELSILGIWTHEATLEICDERDPKSTGTEGYRISYDPNGLFYDTRDTNSAYLYYWTVSRSTVTINAYLNGNLVDSSTSIFDISDNILTLTLSKPSSSVNNQQDCLFTYTYLRIADSPF